MTNEQLRKFCERQISLRAISKELSTEEWRVEDSITELARFWLERQDRKTESVNERLLEACKGMLSSPRYGNEPSEEAVELCRAAIASAERAQAEAALPITEEWLESVGFSLDTMHATMLLRPLYDEAIIELSITPDVEPSTTWTVGLLQGVPDDVHRNDDHVVITSVEFTTRGQLLNLLAALKGE